MNFKRYCATCAQLGNFQNGNPGCAEFKIGVNPNKDFCSWHQEKEETHCTFCPSNQNLTFVEFNDEYYGFCPDHYILLGSCQTCVNVNICGFKDDNSEPLFVTAQTSHHGMTIQTQIRNPNLVNKHCANCRCGFGDNHSCVKQMQVADCGNWQLMEGLLH